MSAGVPEVERLLSLRRDVWRSFGRRLHDIGIELDAMRPILKMSPTGDGLRSPLAKWHLRRLATPAGFAMRMFSFWDAVAADEAQAALGDELPLERFVEVGLLRRVEGGFVSPLVLRPFDEFLLLCDDLLQGGDAVMGPSGGTTTLLDLSYPAQRLGRGLDLGCGAGTLGLVLSRQCDRVVATDVNPRATTLTTINAWMNGVENVDVRRGDLYGPVSGESFDLVVSQPPFVSRPPGTPPSAFLFGGERGDELPLQVLRGAPAHLVPGGSAIVMVEWPVVDGEPPIEQRVRAVAGASTDVLVLQKPPGDLDLNCLAYARIGHPGSDPGYEQAAIARREHLERNKVRALHTAYVIVRRRADAMPAWTSSLPWASAFGDAAPTRAGLDALLVSSDHAQEVTGSVGPNGAAAVDAAIDAVGSALVMGEELAFSGRSSDASSLFENVLRLDPTCATGIRGVARVEIARGRADQVAKGLEELADLGDREARRLLGDVHWSRNELDAALAAYAVEPRPPASPPSRVTPCAVDNEVRVERSATTKRPFLVWVTCPTFDGSMASRWFRPRGARLWDLAVNCFAASPTDRFVGHAEHLVLGGPSKLGSVKATALTQPDLLRGYRGALFLDDDVGIRHEDVDRLFWLMARYQLDLAHPSLSDGSACPMTPMFHQRETAMRYTNVVDVRAPAFSEAGFLTCVDSFDQSVSGHGLAHVWSRLLTERRHAVGVIDTIVAHHLRPIDPVGGSFYAHLRAMGVEPRREQYEVLRQYGCSLSHARSIGDVDHHGNERHYPA